MNNVVLGWCRADAPCTIDVQRTLLEPLAIVSLPYRHASTPRARMRQQVRCFEAGMDLLPVAPRIMLQLHEAKSLAASKMPHLIEKIEQISGFGQLTLRLTALPLEIPKTSQSENWLRERHLMRARQADWRQEIEDAIQRVTLDSRQHANVIHDAARGVAVCHLLVPRDEDAKVKDSIRKQAATVSRSLQSLHITGQWPAYAFAGDWHAKTDRLCA